MNYESLGFNAFPYNVYAIMYVHVNESFLMHLDAHEMIITLLSISAQILTDSSARMAMKEFKFSDGTTVPAGSTVIVLTNAMHHDKAREPWSSSSLILTFAEVL